MKMAKKEQPQEDESYFVAIKSPLEVRKQLLESSKNSIHCLQNYQRILLIRQKKQKEIADMKESVKELIYLNKKLNEKLPKYKVELMQEPKEEKLEVKNLKAKKSVKQAKTPAREKTELEKLEDSLSSIENKLQNLNK
jgi:hypothetical protein